MGADRISVVGCPGNGTSWRLTASIKYSLIAPWPAKFPNRYPTYRNWPDFSAAIQIGEMGAIAGFLVGPVEKGDPGTSTRPPVFWLICSMAILLFPGVFEYRKWPRPSRGISPPCDVSAYVVLGTPDSAPCAALS